MVEEEPDRWDHGAYAAASWVDDGAAAMSELAACTALEQAYMAQSLHDEDGAE